ncbi:MAG: hypothetical protein Q9167_006405 [Letrouitia subvulpina]
MAYIIPAYKVFADIERRFGSQPLLWSDDADIQVAVTNASKELSFMLDETVPTSSHVDAAYRLHSWRPIDVLKEVSKAWNPLCTSGITQSRKWCVKISQRALLNNFVAAASNAVLLLEENAVKKKSSSIEKIRSRMLIGRSNSLGANKLLQEAREARQLPPMVSAHYKTAIESRYNLPYCDRRRASRIMTRLHNNIFSDTGTSLGTLISTPYVRPEFRNMKCTQCSDKSNNFRVHHELQRHTDHVHIKQCRCKVMDNAYYNAAAHLGQFLFSLRDKDSKNYLDEDERHLFGLVGMCGKLLGYDSTNHLWDALSQGSCLGTNIPGWSTSVSAFSKKTLDFGYSFFSYSPRGSISSEPHNGLMLDATWAAWEDIWLSVKETVNVEETKYLEELLSKQIFEGLSNGTERRKASMRNRLQEMIYNLPKNIDTTYPRILMQLILEYPCLALHGRVPVQNMPPMLSNYF